MALEPLWFWRLYPECLLWSDGGRNQTGLSGHEKTLVRKMSRETRVFNNVHEETRLGVAGRICKVERGLKTAFLLKKKIHYWSECNSLGKESH